MEPVCHAGGHWPSRCDAHKTGLEQPEEGCVMGAEENVPDGEFNAHVVEVSKSERSGKLSWMWGTENN